MRKAGSTKLRQLTGTEHKKNFIYIGAFFGAVVASELMPYVIFGSFSRLGLKSILTILAFAAAIVGALYATDERHGNGLVALIAAAGYTLLLALFRVALLSWSIGDAIWGLFAPFAMALVFWWILMEMMTKEFAPIWAVMAIGCVVGLFFGRIISSLVFSVVEDYTWRPLGMIMRIFKYGLVSYGASAVALVGVMFAVHKSQNSPLAKLD